MESLVGYGSDEDIETERYSGNRTSVPYGAGSSRGRDDDNYDSVNMDMSEESEPELPPARPEQTKSRDDRRHAESGKEDGPRGRDADRHRDRRDWDPRDRRHSGSDRGDRRGDSGPREPSRYKPDDRTRPDDRHHEKSSSSTESKSHGDRSSSHSRDAHDAVSHRFIDRRDRDKDRDRDRDRDNRDRHGRKSHDRDRDRGDRSGRRDRHRRSRSRPRNNYPPPDHPASSSGDHRSSGPEYRGPSSYKVNKKLQVMEKMGLQIKTPDGCMKTAQQLREDSGESVSQSVPAANRPNYYNPAGTAANVLEQVKKRKLLWSKAGKSESEETSGGGAVAKWSGTRFAADQDGKQVNKFMRLMGIKDPAAVTKPDEAKEADPIKKQEELFQAMQAQYEVARATTHTMRGVGLGFQRGPF